MKFECRISGPLLNRHTLQWIATLVYHRNVIYWGMVCRRASAFVLGLLGERKTCSRPVMGIHLESIESHNRWVIMESTQTTEASCMLYRVRETVRRLPLPLHGLITATLGPLTTGFSTSPTVAHEAQPIDI
jgi:hypothetical protein